MESNPIVRFRAKPGRKTAIIAMCAHCMGCTETSIEPGFRVDIRDCGSVQCPLHMFRPFQGKDEDEAPFPPAGWLPHPTAPGWFYCGTEVKSEQQLRELMQ